MKMSRKLLNEIEGILGALNVAKKFVMDEKTVVASISKTTVE